MQQSAPLRQRLIHPIFILIVSLVTMIIGVLFIVQIVLPIQGEPIQPLVIAMSSIGILLAVISYIVYKSGAFQYLGSLRLLMFVMVVVIVAVVLFYLWLLSEVLFSSSIYLSFMTMGMFFAGVSAISFGYFVSRAMTQRLFALSDAAGKVAQGNFDIRLQISGNDEIAHLTRSFNAMIHDLQQVDEQKRQLEQTRRDLVAWVSHDLRTPLTSMRVMLEALADGVISDQETQQRYVQTTLSEIQHLSHMITDLFEMAKLDVGHIDLDIHPTPLADLISDTVGSLMAKATMKNLTLEGQVDDSVDLVYVAPDKIQRVLKNLINNAIQYTPDGETVRISAVQHTQDMVKVVVHNTGIHIPDDVLPNLFDSFYRGEKSRATTENDERGTGLGLAIARGFVQAHGGDIWAESHPEMGTSFSFTVPSRTSL